MQYTLDYRPGGRGTLDVTDDIAGAIRQSGVRTGMAHIFIKHTSASLMICENADPTVREDVEYWMAKTVEDGDPAYKHDMEGPDDMPGHIRSILTGMDLTIPVTDGEPNLGVWQGIYLYEHRTSSRDRQLVVTVFDAGR